MTEIQTTGLVPDFDLADRMRKALRVSGLGVAEMADFLEVRRETVGTWINGRIIPRKSTLRLWAMRTGVDLEWLETGVVRHQGLEPRTRWLTASDLQLVA